MSKKNVRLPKRDVSAIKNTLIYMVRSQVEVGKEKMSAAQIEDFADTLISQFSKLNHKTSKSERPDF